jgi:uncharacterized protein with PIN domain
MNVDKIYQNQTENKDEIIYQLKSGLIIIKRDPEEIKKFNLNRWDEINFIPDEFKEIKRELTLEEEREINQFLTRLKARNNSSIWERMKQKWQSIFKKPGSK